MAINNSAKNLALAASGNGEAIAPVEMRSGQVIAVDKSKTPWTLTLRLSEVDIAGITMIGWYDPVVGDQVQVLKQGPQCFVLGTAAPGKVYMPPAPPPPPPPPAPAPPPPPPSVREVGINALAVGTAPAEAPYGGWRSDLLYQSGGALAQRGFWFYGDQIAAAKGAGTIIGARILVKRFSSSHGIGGGANIRLGAHGWPSQPGGIPGPHSNVFVAGQLGRDQASTFGLPQDMINGMNAGAIKGFGLEPGQLGYLSPDYVVAYGVGPGREWSGQLVLTIRG